MSEEDLKRVVLDKLATELEGKEWKDLPKLTMQLWKKDIERAVELALEEVRKDIETARGCLVFKGVRCRQKSCELVLCPLNKKGVAGKAVEGK